LGDIAHRYKTLTTKRYIDGVKQHGWQRFDKKLWQRNYWEHIIRNESEYQRVAQYILENPIKKEQDKLNGDIENRVIESSSAYAEGTWMV